MMKISTLCYIKQNNQTLMLHRIKKKNDIHKNKWNGLGGKLERGESPEECVKREVFEESGLIIESPNLHGVITFPKFDGIDDWIVFVYTANNFEGNLIDCDEGKLDWVSDDQLLKLNLWEGDKIFIPWLTQDKFFSAKFIYEKKKLINYDVIFY
ncbi:MAG: DNA mismatch repair protein MutT [Candidatus Marinimicrobia bacterium]|nr:DNA mismatch repair protein MutT [Candidatus Neomarinimicrobiota bacterium]